MKKANHVTIQLVDSGHILADRAIEHLVEPSREALETSRIKIQYYDDNIVDRCLDSTPLPRSRSSGIEPTDLRSLIYTSGTTGLPKATFISAGR